jgi:teichuronic acid biosynthesis glycosyltransferase TuaH
VTVPDDLVFNLQATSLLASQRRVVHSDDRLVAVLQRDPSVSLLVAEPRRFAAAAALKRIAGEPRPEVVGGTALYQPLRIRRHERTGLTAARRAAQRWDDGLRRRAAAVGMPRPHVVLCNPILAGLADLEWARSVVYYTHDDLATGDDQARYRDAILHAYDRVRERGRAMVSVADVMLERVDPTGPRLLLPNGVDVESFVVEATPAPELAGLPRPLAVYVGNIEGRIAPDLLRAAAEALGGGSIALIGAETSSVTRDATTDVQGLHFVGPVPPGRIPEFLAAADVGIVPHVVSDVTMGMSPLKLYEYLASGLPVAATDLPPMRGVSSRVFLASEPAAFGKATRRALSVGRASADERRQFANENSWAARAHRLVEFCRHVGAER